MRQVSDFRLTARKGKNFHSPYFRISVLKIAGQSQLGIICTKKIGNAVKRNLARRRLQHIARASILANPEGYRVLIWAKPGILQSEYANLEQTYQEMIGSVFS